VSSSVAGTIWSPSTMTGQVSKTMTPSKRHGSLRRYSTNLVPPGRRCSGPTSSSGEGAVLVVGDGDDVSRGPGSGSARGIDGRLTDRRSEGGSANEIGELLNLCEYGGHVHVDGLTRF
jgi:hypothetical protein